MSALSNEIVQNGETVGHARDAAGRSPDAAAAGGRAIRSTGDMLPWDTGRPWEYTRRSHVNRCVFDSAWDATEAFVLDHDPNVAAWAKNDHLGFEIVYLFEGVVRKFRPDFLIRLTNGTTLILEVKGQDSPQNQTKRKFLDEWAQAVNQHGGFGQWSWAVSRAPSDVADVLDQHNRCPLTPSPLPLAGERG